MSAYGFMGKKREINEDIWGGWACGWSVRLVRGQVRPSWNSMLKLKSEAIITHSDVHRQETSSI
jgi:hypothetical protein